MLVRHLAQGRVYFNTVYLVAHQIDDTFGLSTSAELLHPLHGIGKSLRFSDIIDHEGPDSPPVVCTGDGLVPFLTGYSLGKGTKSITGVPDLCLDYPMAVVKLHILCRKFNSDCRRLIDRKLSLDISTSAIMSLYYYLCTMCVFPTPASPTKMTTSVKYAWRIYSYIGVDSLCLSHQL